jgi:XTP/dITP diphosphohydrolase
MSDAATRKSFKGKKCACQYPVLVVRSLAMQPIPVTCATGNPHKVGEMAALVASHGLPWLLRDAVLAGGMDGVVESASDFVGNARIKAEFVARGARLRGLSGWVLADDSGLQVDALGGAPGVHSARYAGDGATTADNNRKLLAALDAVPDAARAAQFVCSLYLIDERGIGYGFRGACRGRIVRQATDGTHGFGYDPLFVPDGHQLSFAQLGDSIKNRISHRALAFAALAAWWALRAGKQEDAR